MVRVPTLLSVHRVVAALLAVVVLSSSLPAHAEETQAEAEHRWAGYAVLGLAGLTVVSGTIAGVGLARANSAYDERRDLSVSLGGTGNVGTSDVGCRTPAECTRKAELRDDQASARTMFYSGAVLAGVFGAAAIVGGVLWLGDSPKKTETRAARLVPSAGPTGGGLNVVGTF